MLWDFLLVARADRHFASEIQACGDQHVIGRRVKHREHARDKLHLLCSYFFKISYQIEGEVALKPFVYMEKSDTPPTSSSFCLSTLGELLPNIFECRLFFRAERNHLTSPFPLHHTLWLLCQPSKSSYNINAASDHFILHMQYIMYLQ